VRRAVTGIRNGLPIWVTHGDLDSWTALDISFIGVLHIALSDGREESLIDFYLHNMMTTIMSSNRPPKKPPPPDPQRSGKPVPKGKGMAKAPMHEVDNQADQTWQGVTFSEDKAPAYKGKKKRKRQLAEEAEEEMSRETMDDRAKKEVWATTRRVDPSMEELNRFLSYRNDVNMDIDAEVNSQSVEMSKASRPTLLWSASSEQFLCPPRNEGHSSGTSSKASKRHRSPSPFGCSRKSRTSSRGHGNPFEAGPPPG
jgi:hypothetical protein